MYKTIIFDFNGTLLDDCDLCLKILNKLCEENNLQQVSKKQYMDIFTFPVVKYYEQIGFNVYDKSIYKVGERFHEYYNDLSYKEVTLFKNVEDVLKTLKKDHTLVCLSASNRETLVKQLKFYNIYHYFDFVVGLTDSYANSKMDVALQFKEKQNLNCQETIFLGDSIHDKEVADAMNVKCVLVSTGHTSKHRLLEVSNDVIDEISQLLNYID